MFLPTHLKFLNLNFSQFHSFYFDQYFQYLDAMWKLSFQFRVAPEYKEVLVKASWKYITQLNTIYLHKLSCLRKKKRCTRCRSSFE